MFYVTTENMRYSNFFYDLFKRFILTLINDKY